MKNLFIAIAIILIAVLALGAFGISLDVTLPDESSDTVTDTQNSAEGTEIPGTGSVGTTEVLEYLYSYHIDVYLQGTSTLMGDIDLDSNATSGTLSYSGNELTLSTSDGAYTLMFSSIKSISSLSVTTVSPGTTAVYITYIPINSGTSGGNSGSSTVCSHLNKGYITCGSNTEHEVYCMDCDAELGYEAHSLDSNYTCTKCNQIYPPS